MVSSVLVSGGYGFIGSHIVDRLLSEGYSVGILDNLSTGTKTNIDSERITKLKFHNVDVVDTISLVKAVKGYEAVLHQAALVSVKRSVEDPITTHKVNATGTLNMLKAALENKVKRFVYASSSSVYGNTESLPKREDMKCSPISPYAVSKLAGECYCTSFAYVYGLVTVSLRYFNVYGPRQREGPYSGVIPIFVEKVMQNENPQIFGDGNQTRDFTYVDDVVQANLLSLEKDIEPGEVFNIATGRPVTINELAQIVCKLSGKTQLRPVHCEQRPGDVKASYADISKASSVLGYRPSISLEHGIKKVIEWFKNRQ
jgi:nucleoside-diphosphate-sugar epimerase